jgi:L-asparaginase
MPVYIGSVNLKKHGVVFSDDLSPWKARILLMLALPITKDPKQLQAYFDK